MVVDAKILILGLTFKENCPDIRNTRVIDIIDSLKQYHTNIEVYDPWVDSEAAVSEFDIELTTVLETDYYDGIVVCVGHDEFKTIGIEKLRSFCKKESVIFDVKSVFDKNDIDGRL